MSRPLSITIIAICMIAFSLITGAAKVYVLFSHEANQLLQTFTQAINKDAMVELPIEFHHAHGLIGTVVWVVAGIFMLRARKWACWLALGWGLSVLVLTVITIGIGFSFYTKSVTYLFLIYFLTNQRARSYYADYMD